MPTNPFTSQTISGYNATPPSNDGAKTSANQVDWDKHKTKLADPIKTLAEAINTAVLAAFAKVINTDSSEINSLAGNLAFPSASITATSDTITPVRSHHTITMTSTATTVRTIVPTSVTEGTILILKSATGKDVTLRDSTTTATAGEIKLRGATNILLSETFPTILQNNSGTWVQWSTT